MVLDRSKKQSLTKYHGKLTHYPGNTFFDNIYKMR
jgi:hypothetical protein